MIRTFEPSDDAACLACVVELQDYERTIDPRSRPGEAMAREYLDDMHARCRASDGVILVADEDSDVAGLVMVLARVPFESLDDPPGSYALVAELVVRAAYRRRGLGARLLHAAERFAVERGASELRIAVLSGNLPAYDLYVRTGFTPYSQTLSKSLEA